MQVGIGPLTHQLTGLTELLGVELLVEDLLHVGVIEASSAEDGAGDVVTRNVGRNSALDHPGHVLDRALARLLLAILATQTRHQNLFIDLRYVHVVESVSSGVDALDDAQSIKCPDWQFDYDNVDALFIAGQDVGRRTIAPGGALSVIAETPTQDLRGQCRSQDGLGIERVLVGGEPPDEVRGGHHRTEARIPKNSFHDPS